MLCSKNINSHKLNLVKFINFFVFLGISYSVSTQEFLVERCLEEDQQLLDALVRNPLLDSDLLTLDDSTLKSQLSDIGDPVETLPAIVNNASDILITPVKAEEHEENFIFAKNESLRRSKRQNESFDDSLSKRNILQFFIKNILLFFFNFSVSGLYYFR